MCYISATLFLPSGSSSACHRCLLIPSVTVPCAIWATPASTFHKIREWLYSQIYGGLALPIYNISFTTWLHYHGCDVDTFIISVFIHVCRYRPWDPGNAWPPWPIPGSTWHRYRAYQKETAVTCRWRPARQRQVGWNVKCEWTLPSDVRLIKVNFTWL